MEKLSHLKRAQSEVHQSEMQQEILKLKQKDIAEELVHSRDEEAKEKVIEAAKNNEAANQLALEKAGEENHVKQSQSSELNNLKQDTVGKDEVIQYS